MGPPIPPYARSAEAAVLVLSALYIVVLGGGPAPSSFALAFAPVRPPVSAPPRRGSASASASSSASSSSPPRPPPDSRPLDSRRRARPRRGVPSAGALRAGGNDDDPPETEPTDGGEREGGGRGGVLSKIDAFLDTPILDANDRSDQGPVAEALKRFVRRDPRVASTAFSAAIILAMLAAVRLANYLTYSV